MALCFESVEMPLYVAVLIDAENLSTQHYPEIRSFAAKTAAPLKIEVHGHLLRPDLRPWAELAERDGLDIRLCSGSGRNAADMSMTIAAMDLLHAGHVSRVCIVSSDGDFTPLARRLRVGGLDVFGIGEGKAPPSFRAACSGFHQLQGPTGNGGRALAAPPPANGPLSAADLKRLHSRIAQVCGPAGLPVTTLAQHLRRDVPDLAGQLGGAGRFLKTLQRLDLVDVQRDGATCKVTARPMRVN